MNGYDPDSGKVMVPFDLKRDVVEPLGRLEDGVADLQSRFAAHISYVDEAVKTRMQPLAEFTEGLRVQVEKRAKHRARVKRVVLWVAGIGGPMILTVVARAIQ